MMPAMVLGPGKGTVSAFACNCRPCTSNFVFAFICCTPELGTAAMTVGKWVYCMQVARARVRRARADEACACTVHEQCQQARARLYLQRCQQRQVILGKCCSSAQRPLKYYYTGSLPKGGQVQAHSKPTWRNDVLRLRRYSRYTEWE